MAEESSLKHRNHTGQNCTGSCYHEGKLNTATRSKRVYTGAVRLTARRVLAVWREREQANDRAAVK